MAPGQQPRRPINIKAWVYFFLVFGMLVAVAAPTLIIIFVGLLPGLISWITDKTDQKYQFFCVFGFNFAGWFPYLMDLWSGNHNYTGALNIITDVFALAVMYGAAAGGWLIYTIIPPVITSFMTVLTERRLSALRSNQRKVIEEWGEEVRLGIGAPPGDSTPPGPPSGEEGMEGLDGMDGEEIADEMDAPPPEAAGAPG